MNFPEVDPELRSRRLTPPIRRSAAVLDTDIANEIDDPFAIAHAMLSPDRIDLRAITIAPYENQQTDPKTSQDRSRDLGQKTLAHLPGSVALVRGAETWCDEGPVECDAVGRIIEESKHADPLYVMAIGAATNVASALLIDPALVHRIVVVWLGGHAPDYRDNREFNLQGDLFASRVLFESGVPLVHYPAMGVTSHLLTSAAAMRNDLSTNELGKFLIGLMEGYARDHFAWEKELWDVGVTSYLVQPDWTATTLEPTPTLAPDSGYVRRPAAPIHRRATYVSRNAVLGDLFRKIHEHH